MNVFVRDCLFKLFSLLELFLRLYQSRPCVTIQTIYTMDWIILGTTFQPREYFYTKNQPCHLSFIEERCKMNVVIFKRRTCQSHDVHILSFFAESFSTPVCATASFMISALQWRKKLKLYTFFFEKCKILAES